MQQTSPQTHNTATKSVRLLVFAGGVSVGTFKDGIIWVEMSQVDEQNLETIVEAFGAERILEQIGKKAIRKFLK